MYNSFMGIKEEENAIKAVSALIAGTAFTYVIPFLKPHSQMIP